MKRLLTLSLISLIPYASQALTGSGAILLNQKPVAIQVQAKSGTGSLKIGGLDFAISGTSSNKVEGLRLIRKDGRKVEDIKAQIYLGEPKELAELKDYVQNAAEVNCDSSSNAFVILSDDIRNTVVGNCVSLK